MIVNHEEKQIIRSNDFEHHEFKVDVSVLSILRNSLYSRKAEAACRETTCNALDAHVDAGIVEIPIEVTLPTLFDPVFKVRDYGKSMSDEVVRDIYSYYGKSTKRTSNQAVGGFGIGKLSPLCIAPAFQLTCVQNNYKRIYTIYVNEQNIDQIDLIFEGETDEKNGTEVSFGVKPADINQFEEACGKVFRFWPTYPIIHNCPDYTKEVIEYHLLKPSRWGFMKNVSAPCVVCGPIAYSIDESQIPNLNDVQRKIINKGLAIFVGIGDVNLQASRESISYTPKTIKFLQSKIREIENEIIEEVKSKLDSLKTELDGRRFFHNIFTELGELGVISDLVKSNIQVVVNGMPIVESFFRINKDLNISLKEVALRRNKQWKSVARVDYTEIFQFFHAENPINDATRLFYDLKWSKNGRIRNLCKYYFEQNKFADGQLVYVFQVNHISQLQSYCDKTGIDINLFKDINQTIIIPKKTRVKSDGDKIVSNCKIYDGDDSYDGDDIVEDDGSDIKSLDLDFSSVESAYCIFSHYGKYYYYEGVKSVEVSLSTIHNFLKEVDSEYAENPIIYIVPLKNKAKITNKFKRIGEILPNLIQTYFGELPCDKTNISKINSDLNYPIKGLKKAIEKGNYVPSEFLVEIFEKIDFASSVNDPYIYIANDFGIKTENPNYQKNLNEITKLIKKFLSNYPLFEDITYYQWDYSDKVKKYIEYMNLIDEKNLQKSLEFSPVTV